MKRAFLLAHPAGHSLSPAMHNAAFEALGIDARYEALDVPPAELARAVASLRDEAVLGANVTVPHKVTVMPHLDELTDAARAVGAVNTVVNDRGRLTGDNSDALGFLSALRDDADFDPRGCTAVVLGAGGAARAVVHALLTSGARVGVHNRTPERAEALAASFREHGEIAALGDDALEPAVRAADLLVNTTSVGMEHGGVDPDASPLRSGVLPERGFVSDIVYRPARTRLLRDAAAAGLPVQNGVMMLVRQGAAAFERWTGRQAPVDVMRQALEAALTPAKRGA